MHETATRSAEALTIPGVDDLWSTSPDCERGKVECARSATWRGRLECGHGGLLCDVHQAEGVRKLENPRWRWFCHVCGHQTASVTWHRL